MTLDWQAPPVPARGRVFDRDTLSELRSQPGRWARVRSYRNNKGWRAIKHPIDIECRWTYDSQTNTSNLYARAIRRES